MSDAPAHAFPRLVAFAVDWSVAALWGGLVFGAVMLATGGDLPRLDNPWTAQAIGFLTMTLPFTLYFAVCESSRWRGTVGKRVAGLVVLRRSGEPVSFARALLRNAAKFVPWEFGHTLAQQMAHGEGDEFPLWLWGPAVIALVGPGWWLAAVLVRRDPPYDRWTDTRVQSARPR